MKLPFTIHDSRFTIWKKSSKPAVAGGRANAAGNRQSPIVNRKSQRGIALVITLILLSVTLVMAVAFLAISRRERGSVTTSTDTVTARLAADAALANAQAQIIANIYATANPYSPSLIVSTNFINENGFKNTGAGIADPTNVNYDFYNGVAGVPLNNAADLEQNIANLLYLPRAPVFVTTNRQTGASEFRYYLDLNRNGSFEANGNVPNVDSFGVTNGTLSEVGDPEWIGVLERPDVPHGPNNKFVSRYAFVVVPAGGLNDIYNQALTRTLNPPLNTPDGYFRNQGVGSWEINLAAFLTDLNTNQWDPPTILNSLAEPYQYPAVVGNSVAFDDARALLAFRYANNYSSLSTAGGLNGLFTTATTFLPFQNNIDAYGNGPLMTTPAGINVSGQSVTIPWAGADNTNHFFAESSDLFDPNKNSMAFTNHLLSAGNYVAANGAHPTYDRYTFYRLLAQLGTDSAPETGKMNLNYDNLDSAGNVVPNAETNFIAWTPIRFFTNAADRMLREYSATWFRADPSNYLATYYGIHTNYYYTDANNNIHTNDPSGVGLTSVLGVPNVLGQTNDHPLSFGITNIPVLANGQFVYTPAVQRVLQLAANIYDATTNKTAWLGKDYPSVFRPVLYKTVSGFMTNVIIVGYQEISSLNNLVAGSAPLDVPRDIASLPDNDYTPLNPFLPAGLTQPNGNVYGVPWIVGAKKGFPNFNEFSMENNLAVTRRLQFTRMTNSSPYVAPTITGTNQMYTMSLSSSIGVELWNSYSNNFTDPVIIGLNENASMVITNDDHGQNLVFTKTFSTNVVSTINLWPGSGKWIGGNPNANSFIFANYNGPTLTNAVYRSRYAQGNSAYTLGLTAPGFIATNYFTSSSPLLFETNSPNGFYLPQFGVQLTNRLQFFMLSSANGSTYHVIDYVHFAGPNSSFNVNSNLADGDIGDTVDHAYGMGVWDTNYPSGTVVPTGPTYGILKQIAVSKSGAPPKEDGAWQADPEAVPLGGSTNAQQAFFGAFFMPGNRVTTPAYATNLQLSVQAPYSPTRYIVQYLTWQANDPLVHYLASDIDTPPANSSTTPAPGLSHYNAGQTFSGLTNLNLGSLNDRYMPWSGNHHFTDEQLATSDPNRFNFAERDPLATNSDSWIFPTNKLPTVGWLGRVHRGTPWQTVYLKASPVNTNTWINWTGNSNTNDAINELPTTDRLLFDNFTTALNDNATRGQLSVNTGANGPSLAAWSAVFSGIAVPTSLTNTYSIINPAGVYDPTVALTNQPLLVQIAQGINSTRANTNLFPQQAFEHVGDVLATPQLTEQSPFLVGQNVTNNLVSDALMEWLPQQTLSLLRVSSAPRYVIYSYGQTLTPAPNAVVTGGPNLANGASPFGMVTNYQVVAETATRAVVQVNQIVTTNFNGTLSTNYNTKIEQFNLLPPD